MEDEASNLSADIAAAFFMAIRRTKRLRAQMEHAIANNTNPIKGKEGIK